MRLKRSGILASLAITLGISCVPSTLGLTAMAESASSSTITTELPAQVLSERAADKGTWAPYQCQDGFRFSLGKVDDKVVQIRQSAGAILSIPAAISASGAKYEAPGAMIWFKGQEARLKLGSSEHSDCIPLPASTKPARIPAVEAGYMTLSSDGDFHAEQVLTRAQLAQVLVKAFELAKRKPSVQPPSVIPDVPTSHWAYDAIRVTLSTNVMDGYYTSGGDNRFFPNQPLTRAEGFAIFAQADGVYPLSSDDVDAMLANYSDSDKLPGWTRKAIATALKEGFINIRLKDDETPLRYLNPNVPMTRGDLAFALNRLISRKNDSTPAGTVGPD